MTKQFNLWERLFSRDKSMGVPLYDAMRYLPCLSRAQ